MNAPWQARTYFSNEWPTTQVSRARTVLAGLAASLTMATIIVAILRPSAVIRHLGPQCLRWWPVSAMLFAALTLLEPRTRFYARHGLKWTADSLVQLICNYGESIGRILITLGATQVLFAFICWVCHGLVDMNGTPTTRLSDYYLYSLGGLVATNLERLRPKGFWMEMFSILEGMIGIALTGLLGFVLGNRIRRS